MARSKNFFLNNPKSANIPLLTTNANTNWGINLDSIQELFNDRIDVYKSFCDYYSPDSSYIIPTKRLLHMCHKCAKLGKHLYIHQLEHIHRCPIHNQKLQPECFKCNKILGVFAIPENQNKFDIFNLFKCKSCGHNNLFLSDYSKNEIIKVEKKINFILNEYQKWISDCRLKYQSYNWSDNSSMFYTWELTTQITDKPQLLKKYLHLDEKRLFSGSVKYKNELKFNKNKQENLGYSQIIEFSRIIELTMNITLDADIFLENFRSKFNITDKQISMAKITRKFTDIFWGDNYSVWALAYVETETALSASFRKSNMATLGVYTTSWIIHCWYHYLVRWLQRRSDFNIERDIDFLSSLSKVWIRKFLTQVFVDELFSACSNLLEPPKMTWYIPVADRVDIEYKNSNSMMMHNENTGINIFTFWRSGPSITQLICLHDAGFLGYTTNKHINYQNYKTIHKIFAVKDRARKFHDYNRMVQMHPITELSDYFHL